MAWSIRLGIVLIGVCFTTPLLGQSAQDYSARDATRRTHQAALEDPFDPTRFQAFLKTLPRDGEYFVLEGDLLVTEAEVRAYLVSRAASASRAGIKPELLVNVHNGQRDYYAQRDARTLRYAIDRASFPDPSRFELIREAMRSAARAWQDACTSCGIFFEEVPPGSSSGRPSFTVQHHDAGGAYIAAAFFPYYPPARKVLRIDPSYFVTTFDRIGVLRHELGHVLGYRHEHIRDVIGCAREDRGWQPLTPYDPHSVMHYMCGGGGGLALALTELDVIGHRQLYGGESQTPAQTTALVEPKGPRAAATEAAMRAAFADPFDTAKLDALLKLLPALGEYFIVEGDIKMTRQEVIAYLASRSTADASTGVTPELLVNLHRGAPDFYRSREARRLTYRVDRNSFSNATEYQQVVADMRDATRDWVTACADCAITFVAVEPSDATANFTVRRLDGGGSYIAAAFFPHDAPARRFVDIDPSYFRTSFNRVGVLRHELGHVLGYRHEHIRGIAGCFREDNEWRPLTAYDPKSVMHYFCGGAGSRELSLTETDRAGHTRLYTISAGSASDDAATLVVALEGGNVAESAASVLMLLNSMAMLPVSSRPVAAGENVSTIYRGVLGVPGYSTAMTSLASKLNGRDVLRRPLAVNETLRYPDVRFRPYEFELLLDRKDDRQRIKDIEQNWGNIAVQKPLSVPKSARIPEGAYFEVTGYELRVTVPSAQRAQEAVERINQLKSKNILATVQSRQAAKYYSFEAGSGVTTKRPIEQFLSLVDSTNHIAPADEEGSIVSLLGPTTLAGKRTCAANCPRVVLFDGRPSVHPDLSGALEGEVDRSVEQMPLTNGAQQTFQLEATFKPEYHSTHLAGIVAARENGFGLIGVDPEATVIWQDWDKLRTDTMDAGGKMLRRQREARGVGALQIYLFATSWVSTYTTRELRNSKDPLAKRLTTLVYKPLVIAAAGQAATGGVGQRLSEATPEGPMAMGMEDFVLVVTACQPCTGASRALVPEANRSKQLVHVAAPGIGVVSTVYAGRYTKGGGTSQASAFVAGLASAMAARFPNAYDAVGLKLRLQVTSTPVELYGGTATELAAGIIDPELAMLDPTKTWVKYNGTNWQAVTDFEWLLKAISADDLLNTDTHGVSRLLRVVKVNNQWMLYHEDGDASIVKTGPVTIRAEELSKPVATINGVRKTLAEIEDLILKFAHPEPRQ